MCCIVVWTHVVIAVHASAYESMLLLDGVLWQHPWANSASFEPAVTACQGTKRLCGATHGKRLMTAKPPHLPVEEVIAHRAGAAGCRRVPLEVLP